MRELTNEEQEILAHVVIDPQAWWAHASNPDVYIDKETGLNKWEPEEALAAKCARWKPDYEKHLKECEAMGEKYKCRAIRQKEEDEAADLKQKQQIEQMQKEAEAKKEADAAEFKKAVAQAVAEALEAGKLLASLTPDN